VLWLLAYRDKKVVNCLCAFSLPLHFEPNYEGLGLQDEYLRSDGVGRDFLKIDAGGSLNPTSIDTITEDIISFKMVKQFLNMLLPIWLMQVS
jgi:hypothetical protein